MTRGELRTRALTRLNDPAGVMIPAAEVNASLDDALEVWAEESGAVTRTVTLPLQPGMAQYWLTAVLTDVMAPWRLWLHDQATRLPAVSMKDLDLRHYAWPTVTGFPECWYPISWDSFGLWPVPTAGGYLLRVDYLAWPRALLDDGDEPEFPDRDHEAFLDYAVYEGLAKRWEAMHAVEVWSRFQGRIGTDAWGTNVRRTQLAGRAADEAAGYTSGLGELV